MLFRSHLIMEDERIANKVCVNPSSCPRKRKRSLLHRAFFQCSSSIAEKMRSDFEIKVKVVSGLNPCGQGMHACKGERESD